jgi:hypothetical protein
MARAARTNSSRRGKAWRAAERYGFDMSIIEANLKLTPWQRIVNHSGALRLAEMLRDGMEKKLDQSRRTPSASHKSKG